MDRALAALIPVPEPGPPDHPDVLAWGCPVPFFGHLESACLATVGINPSNREFAGTDGSELTGPARRLPTLGSLGLSSWTQADHHVQITVAQACCQYFERSPYHGWFGILERLIEPTGCSYHPPAAGACHLDLIPWATTRKWGMLPPSSRALLLGHAAQAIIAVIAHAPLAMLVLNGSEVVRQFQAITGQPLESERVPGWDLARTNGQPVPGVAYTGTISTIGGTPLGRKIVVAGYNHNLQSSFGVTVAVRAAISTWITGQYQPLTAAGNPVPRPVTRPAAR